MSRLGRYLALLFLQRLLITGFAMVILLGVLDALGNADLLPENAGLADNLRYMLLRMPILFDRILMFALLAALLLTFMTLIRRNELVAIAGAGISAFGQVRALLLAVVLASVAAGGLIDQVNPRAKAALENWLGAEVLRKEGRGTGDLWLAEDGLLVEIEGLQNGALTGLTLFERTETGRIAAVSTAARATPGAGGWVLSGVAQERFDGKPLAPPAIWQTGQTARSLGLLLAEPRDLAAADLLRLARMTHSGNQPRQSYLVWFWNRLFLPVVATGFLMFAAAIMQRFGRRDSGVGAMAVGLAVGFVYMVADGIFKSFAESGTVSGLLAVALPAAVLLLAGALMILLRRSPG